MQRRAMLELFGGIAVGALTGFRFPGRRRDRVVVVGGGIIGASIAYHLARRGAQVTLVEKTGPAAGATQNSFAWINAGFGKLPFHYHRLNRLSMLAYRHLERELDGQLRVQWGGSLQWADNPKDAARLRQRVRRHQRWGYATRLLNQAGFHDLEPELQPGTVVAAAHSEHEGSVDPVAATQALLQGAAALGARIQYPCEVTGLDLRWGAMQGIATTRGDLAADVIVVAAGVDTPLVAKMVGLSVPLKDSPGLLAHTKPVDRAVHRVVVGPGAHLKQKLDGRIVTGTSFGPSAITEPSAEQGERILSSTARFLPGLAQAEVEQVTLGWRPLPQDNYPIVGFASGAPQIYLAVMHSGVTLAPLVGRLVSMELLDDVRVELFEPYRLERFSEGTTGAP